MNQTEPATRFSSSDVPLKARYDASDLVGWDPAVELGEPGSYPFTRGIHREMYTKRRWSVRQYAGFGSAEDTNERFRFLMDNGQSGLSLAFDLPTQVGLDSDDDAAFGEVGRLGVAIDTMDDMARVYDQIPLDTTSTSMTINATAPIILAMYVAVADERGTPRAALGGTVQNDLFKEYLARGLYVFPPGPSLRLSGDVIEFCVRELPKFNPVSVSAPHIRSAGARYSDALAYMFLAAQLMVSEVMARGVNIDDIGPRISFLAGSDHDFFETICRHRASRRLWARTMKERFGATEARAMWYRLGASGDPLNLTYQQPLNNLARITLQGLANVLGGCQSMVLPCWDEAYTIPTEDAVRLSLNIQRIIGEESAVADVVDPLGGSYFIESLTNEIEERIVAKMLAIDEAGGLIAAIEDGSIHSEMAQRASRQERAIQEGTRVVVGVNRYEVAEDRRDVEASMHVTDPETADRQITRLQDARSRRDPGAVDRALEAVRSAVENQENVMEPLVAAVKQRATIGELTAQIAQVVGRYRAVSPL